MKKIVILGKPNVGKSSLFNRLLRERKAITSDIAGTTRDTNSASIELEGHFIELIDTGGIDESSQLFSKVKELSLKSAKEADLILYVVDGKILPQEEDRQLFFTLQKEGKTCFLVINKIDNDKEKQMEWEFTHFGAKKSFLISVSHNRGISTLKYAILSAFDLTPRIDSYTEIPPQDKQNNQVPSIRVGIIGRVNVGKSSLLNALLGSERSVVSDIAGTTIDPVDEEIEFSKHRICFVDTAGIRRKSKIEGIEKYALDRTQKILEQSNVALLVLDVSEGFVELDERISSLVDQFSLGVIVILNKWDIKKEDFKSITMEYKRKFKFLEYAPFLTVSAKNGRHIQEIKTKILEVYDNYARRIPTSKLNETIIQATRNHPLPSDHGKIVRIYYATQFQTCPPQIALVMNRPKALHFSYKRYLTNYLRKVFDFSGTPVLIFTRGKNDSVSRDEDLQE